MYGKIMKQIDRL